MIFPFLFSPHIHFVFKTISLVYCGPSSCSDIQTDISKLRFMDYLFELSACLLPLSLVAWAVTGTGQHIGMKMDNMGPSVYGHIQSGLVGGVIETWVAQGDGES